MHALYPEFVYAAHDAAGRFAWLVFACGEPCAFGRLARMTAMFVSRHCPDAQWCKHLTCLLLLLIITFQVELTVCTHRQLECYDRAAQTNGGLPF